MCSMTLARHVYLAAAAEDETAEAGPAGGGAQARGGCGLHVGREVRVVDEHYARGSCGLCVGSAVRVFDKCGCGLGL